MSLHNIQADQDYIDKTEAKADSLVQQIAGMTPTQVANYIDTNVTDLASAKTVLKAMGKIIVILATELQL